MPSNKDFKRLVRRRSAKTGESYTTARGQLLRRSPARPAQPIRIAVHGAAGRVGYTLAFRLAAGDGLGGGAESPIDLRLLDLPEAAGRLEAMAMELEDCSYPALARVDVTHDPASAFDGTDWIVLAGSPPRRPGMERGDLLTQSAAAFAATGATINQRAGDGVRVLVVGNPSNTNCLVARMSAPDVPADRWFSLMRFDQNRARSRLAARAGIPVAEVTRLAVWGNHSATLYPDYPNARIGGAPVNDIIGDPEWLEDDFVPWVQRRGAQLLEVGGASSAASAADAIVGTLHDLTSPTPRGDCTSVAVVSRGEYGVPEGLQFGFPVAVQKSGWRVLDGFEHDATARHRLQATIDELVAEREAVRTVIG